MFLYGDDDEGDSCGGSANGRLRASDGRGRSAAGIGGEGGKILARFIEDRTFARLLNSDIAGGGGCARADGMDVEGEMSLMDESNAGGLGEREGRSGTP